MTLTLHKKRKNTVVKSFDLYTIRNGLVGISVFLFLLGGFLVTKNPQITNPARDRQIYENGVLKTEVVFQPSTQARLLGLLLLSGSIASILGAIKIGNPTTLDHPEIAKEILGLPLSQKLEQSIDHSNSSRVLVQITEPRQLITDQLQTLQSSPQVQQTKEKLMEKLVNEIVLHPWILQTIKCPSVVLVGNTGSGKSRVAMVLALIQAIFNNRKLLIIDPDANGDLEKGTWIAGKIYGYYRSSISEQMKDLIEGIDLVRNPLTTKTTVIFDEISKYDSYPELEQYLEAIIASGSQEQRKREGCSFYLMHSLQKGMVSEKLPSGRLKLLLQTSAIIYIPNESDILGEPIKGDNLLFKKPNEPISKENWTAYDLPKSLDPSVFSEVYRPLINLMGLELTINALSSESEHQKKQSEAQQKLLDQALSMSDDSDYSSISNFSVELINYLKDYVTRSTTFNLDQSIDIKRLYDSTRKQLEARSLLRGANKAEFFRNSISQSSLCQVSEDGKYFQFRGSHE